MRTVPDRADSDESGVARQHTERSRETAKVVEYSDLCPAKRPSRAVDVREQCSADKGPAEQQLSGPVRQLSRIPGAPGDLPICPASDMPGSRYLSEPPDAASLEPCSGYLSLPSRVAPQVRQANRCLSAHAALSAPYSCSRPVM